MLIENGGALPLKRFGDSRGSQVGTGHLITKVQQNFGDAAHADSADADEVNVFNSFKHGGPTVSRPSWTGGVDATSREHREASFDGADGVVDQNAWSSFESDQPPRLRHQRKLRSFLLAQPPL